MNKIQGMNDCLCPRVQTTFMPSISFMIPFINYQIIWYTILHTSLFCRLIPLIFQKAIISTASSQLSCSTKLTVKSMTWLECTFQNRVCVVPVHTPWRITTNILGAFQIFQHTSFFCFCFCFFVLFCFVFSFMSDFARVLSELGLSCHQQHSAEFCAKLLNDWVTESKG